ncbi:MAG TPA: methyltransferase domain-containing protein [Acidimicrobiales bacterium]|nr:methyltransferase domain-containing protein [Acidimicrobiales bacterium]
MDGPRYDTDVDLSNRNNSHTLMVELVGGTKRVLDVGCATGYLAQALGERGCTVSGVESDVEAAEQARPHLERLVVGDVETMDLAEVFGEDRFDVIVFGDVLEHLRNPLPALRKAKALLTERGSVVASIPNIAHGSVRLALLAGRFDYQELGLLDSTHVRFFTRSSIEDLFREAGMVPIDVRRTTAGFFDTPVPVTESEFAPEVVDAVRADPESSTYQFVLRAVADDADAAVAQLRSEAEAQRARIATLESDMATARQTVQELLTRAEEAEKRADDLETRLAGASEELDRARTELDGLRDHLEEVLATRIMRYSRQARSVYSRLRALRGDGPHG